MTKLEKILSDYKKGILSDSDATKAIMKLQNSKKEKTDEEPKPVKRETKHNVDPCGSSRSSISSCETEPKSVKREIIHNVDPCRSSGNGGYRSSCETEPVSRRVSSGCGSVSEPKPKKTIKRKTLKFSGYDGGCGSKSTGC